MKRRKAVQSLTALLGYSLSPVAITGLVSSCREDKMEIGWQPNFFAKEDLPILAKLGEAFLPRTETPGAMDVDAHLFVDIFLGKVAKPTDQEIVKNGYTIWKDDFQTVTGLSIDKASQEDFVKNLKVYYELGPKELKKVQKMLSADVPSASNEIKAHAIYSFLRKFKPLLMLGYYASEEVGENVLSYLPVPGDYQGCIPVSEVGNAWSIK